MSKSVSLAVLENLGFVVVSASIPDHLHVLNEDDLDASERSVIVTSAICG